MSYDLSFWREHSGFSAEPHSTYLRLSNGEPVEGIASLPTAAILSAIGAAFDDGWTQDDSTHWRHPERGAFEAYLTEQFFRVDCHGMSGDDMNRFVDIGLAFDCPLYDAQVDQRFVDA